MARSSFPIWLTPAVIILLAAAPFALGAVKNGDPQLAGLALPASRNLDNSADVQLRFVQEDGPASGHVRVELTPETRALTAFEARAAAQQGFLEALKEPGLGDDLRRITVVVRLLPGGEVAGAAEHVVHFVHKGGSDWSVLAGD